MKITTWNVNGLHALLRKEIWIWGLVEHSNVVWLKGNKTRLIQLATDTTEFLDFCLKNALGCKVPLKVASLMIKELNIQKWCSTPSGHIVSMQCIAILVGV